MEALDLTAAPPRSARNDRDAAALLGAFAAHAKVAREFTNFTAVYKWKHGRVSRALGDVCRRHALGRAERGAGSGSVTVVPASPC